VEGGFPTADKTEFLECFRTTWKTPYILRLAATAGIGGLLFGYDTGTYTPKSIFVFLRLSFFQCLSVALFMEFGGGINSLLFSFIWLVSLMIE